MSFDIVKLKLFFFCCRMSSEEGGRLVHVAGLEESVTKDVLFGAFCVFGEIRNVDIPIDVKTGTHRGFAFIEFMEADDANDAVDNMHESELYGRTIRVKLSSKRPLGQLQDPKRAVWADDIFYKKVVARPMADDDDT